MKLYAIISCSGLWRVETSRGRRLFEGWLRADGSISSTDFIPHAIESAVRRSWVSGQVVTLDYTPDVAPRLGA